MVEREVASPRFIYECLGIEKKQTTKPYKKDIEESIEVAHSILSEESSIPIIEVANTGQQEAAAKPDELQKRLEEANNKIKELQLQTNKPVPLAVAAPDVQKNLVIPLG